MNSTIFKTDHKNTYLYSFNQKHIILSHPILTYYVYKVIIEEDIFSIRNVLLLDTMCIEGVIYNKREIFHYYKKFLFLKEHGFFEELNTHSILSGKINYTEIDRQLESINTVVFEITERCNLSCKYCVYNDHYVMHTERAYNDLDVEIAKQTLNYLALKWISNKENFYKELVIGFYGGEPLLRFDIVKKIIEYSKLITQKTGLKFKYLMTTNGVLLNKYIDEIVENNFFLTVSLDGNKINNSYRVFPNNTSSFDIVHQNIKLIKDKYPEFFQDSVSINSVLHDLNNENDIKKYFINEFGKQVSTNFIRDADKIEKSAFVNSNDKITKDSIQKNDIEDYFILNHSLGVFSFLKSYNRNIFRSYDKIEETKWDTKLFYPTSVCFPFSKKIFVTSQGKIFPCERINFSFELGFVDNNEVYINTQLIAEKYNKYFEGTKRLCMNCYNFINCQSCLFVDVINNNGSVKCESFIDRTTHNIYLSEHWSFFENNPLLYPEIIKRTNYD